MTDTSMRTTEIDLESEFFEEHVQFLTKITAEKVSENKYKLKYPRKFKSTATFIKHFEYLLWFWFMTSTMEKFMQEQQNKGDIPSYAR